MLPDGRGHAYSDGGFDRLLRAVFEGEGNIPMITLLRISAWEGGGDTDPPPFTICTYNISATCEHLESVNAMNDMSMDERDNMQMGFCSLELSFQREGARWYWCMFPSRRKADEQYIIVRWTSAPCRRRWDKQ